MRLRISARCLAHFSGSQFYVDMHKADAADDPRNLALWRRMFDAPTREDGSVLVDVDDRDAATLRLFAEVLAMGADNVGGYGEFNADAMADLNAGRALVAQIDKARQARP